MELCKIDLLTRIQNLLKLSLIVFELDALFSHVSSDGRSVGRTEKLSHTGAPLLTKCPLTNLHKLYTPTYIQMSGLSD